MLHWDNADSRSFNFVTFKKDGTVNTNYFAGKTEEIGHLEIGEKYLERLASLLKNGQVIKKGNTWVWHVKNNNDFPVTSQILQVGDQWLEIIQDTVDQINEVSRIS